MPSPDWHMLIIHVAQGSKTWVWILALLLSSSVAWGQVIGFLSILILLSRLLTVTSEMRGHVEVMCVEGFPQVLVHANQDLSLLFPSVEWFCYVHFIGLGHQASCLKILHRKHLPSGKIHTTLAMNALTPTRLRLGQARWAQVLWVWRRCLKYCRRLSKTT